MFAQAGALAAGGLGVDAHEVADALAARERTGSTGYGNGVAVSDVRVAGIDRIAALVVRLAHPIEFAAVDAARVDLVAILLSPRDAGAEHLKALSRVARRFRDRGFVDMLRGAGSRDAFYAVLAAEAERDAAA